MIISGPNPRSNFWIPLFVTQSNVQPTHDTQPSTSTSEAVGSTFVDPAVSANGNDSISNTTQSVTKANNNNKQEHAPDGGLHLPGDAPPNDQQQNNRLITKDDQRHDLSRASSHTSLNSIDSHPLPKITSIKAHFEQYFSQIF